MCGRRGFVGEGSAGVWGKVWVFYTVDWKKVGKRRNGEVRNDVHVGFPVSGDIIFPLAAIHKRSGRKPVNPAP